jgi:hypothetical protein
MPLNFYFHGGPVGYFSDRTSYPRSPGIYAYVPYRSAAHKRAGEESTRTGFAWCTFRDANAEFRFKARLGLALYRIEILDVIRVTDLTPSADPASGSRAFALERWSIVPGPPTIHPPFLSIELDEIEQYSPDVVAAAVLRIPGVQLIRPANPDWWSWVARWSTDGGHIDLAMTLFDVRSAAWGGFNLAGTAPASALLDLYSQIRTALPATWLHDDATTLHSAETFAAAIVDMRT